MIIIFSILYSPNQTVNDDKMNYVYLTAGILILTGSAFLYFLLMKYSQKKIIFEKNHSITPDKELIPLEETDAPADNLEWNLPAFSGKLKLKQIPQTLSPARETNFFRFRLHSYEGKDYIGHTENLQSLSKKFLEIVSETVQGFDSTLYLKDSGGFFQAVFKRQGRIHLSGKAIQKTLHEDLAEYLEENTVYLSEEENSCFITVKNDTGMAGILQLHCRNKIPDQKRILAVQQECLRFGELLYQSFIYENATVDTKTGLLNGMKFQNDLNHEFQMKDSLNGMRQLILAETDREFLPAAGRIFSEVLHDSYRIYRIASGILAVLGPEMNENEYMIFQEKIQNKIDIRNLRIYLGRSVLRNFIHSPSSWLQSAEDDLRGNTNFPETDAGIAVI